MFNIIKNRKLHKGIICLECVKNNKGNSSYQIVFIKQGNKKTNKEYLGFAIPCGTEKHISLNIIRLSFLLKNDIPMTVPVKFLIAKYMSNFFMLSN